MGLPPAPPGNPPGLLTVGVTQAPRKVILSCKLVVFLPLGTAGSSSRPGGGVVEQLITNFALGEICIP